jgi:ribonuclease HI
MVTMFTDGASRGNPGPGGYGVILVSGNHRKELSKGFRKTTNNRMELLSVIAGLEALKKDHEQVLVYSDSKYVVDSVEKGWVFGWAKKNFHNKKNADLWKKFIELYNRHEIKFRWIKGHNNHVENERCDVLAVEAALGGNLDIDAGFESGAYN